MPSPPLCTDQPMADTPPDVVSCHVCGSMTPRHSANQRYCSRHCSDVWHNAKRRNLAAIGAALLAGAPIHMQAQTPPTTAGTPQLDHTPTHADTDIRRVSEQGGAGRVIPRTHDYAGIKQARHLDRFGLSDPAPAKVPGAIAEPRRR